MPPKETNYYNKKLNGSIWPIDSGGAWKDKTTETQPSPSGGLSGWLRIYTDINGCCSGCAATARGISTVRRCIAGREQGKRSVVMCIRAVILTKRVTEQIITIVWKMFEGSLKMHRVTRKMRRSIPTMQRSIPTMQRSIPKMQRSIPKR